MHGGILGSFIGGLGAVSCFYKSIMPCTNGVRVRVRVKVRVKVRVRVRVRFVVLTQIRSPYPRSSWTTRDVSGHLGHVR